MALITTIEELKEYLRIPTTNITSKMPAIQVAEDKYILPILGAALYTRLQEAYDSDALTPSLEALLKRCRSVIAPMSYLYDLPYLQTNLSDQGVKVLETDNSRKAFKWEYNEVKESLSDNGYSSMEALIVYLKEYRVDFPEWDSASYNDPDKCYLVRDGNDLRQAVALLQPHRCFLLLQPLLPAVCDLQVKPYISAVFFDLFNQRIIDGDLMAIEKPLARDLQAATARYAMAQAAVELSVRFSGNGFTIVDAMKDLPDDGRTDTNNTRLKMLQQEMLRTANAYMDKAVKYLLQHADDPAFAAWKSSDAYPVNGQQNTDTGNDRRRIFIAG